MNLKPSPRLRRLHGRLIAQLDELITLTGNPELLGRRVENVSVWSVGQHLEHLLHSDTVILDRWQQIEQGRAPSSTGSPHFLGRLSLWIGWIPRGKGKAIPVVSPKDISHQELARGLTALRARIDLLGGDLAVHATASWRARHPVFGALSPTQWLRFIEVHHRHHLAIVADILQAARAGNPSF